MRQLGLRARVLERANNVGGVWHLEPVPWWAIRLGELHVRFLIFTTCPRQVALTVYHLQY
jgi:hypothetical protein